MKLDKDCIRDILLFIEDNTTFENRFVDVDILLTHVNYDPDTIYYHLAMISQAKLVDRVAFADNRPYLVSALSWNGHEYLDNIRDNDVWKFIKEKTSKVSSISLNLLIQLAPTLLTEYLKSH